MSFVVMTLLVVLFATVHSGLAALRLPIEKRIGARVYRILFALSSIGLAVPMLIYYFNHRYDGWQLWLLQDSALVKSFVLGLAAFSFLFLYPATFNLLEVAAINEPKVRIYETGITRITRHPQLTGMFLWNVAHVLWMGSGFALWTGILLTGYHVFAVWHGDRRLKIRYGRAFEEFKSRTSVLPFIAIFQGRQALVLTEFLRPAYLGIAIFVFLTFWAHPWLIETFAKTGW